MSLLAKISISIKEGIDRQTKISMSVATMHDSLGNVLKKDEKNNSGRNEMVNRDLMDTNTLMNSSNKSF